MWYLIIFLLGAVLGPLLLPRALTLQTPAAAAANLPWSSASTVCYSIADASGALFTDQQVWFWGILFAGVAVIGMAFVTLCVLLETRPEYLDSARDSIANLVGALERLGCATCVAIKESAIPIGKWSLAIVTDWSDLFLRICNDQFITSPALLEKVSQLNEHIAALERNLAVYKTNVAYYESVYPGTVSALNNADEERKRSQKEVEKLQTVIKALESDKDVERFNCERAVLKNEIAKVEEKLEKAKLEKAWQAEYLKRHRQQAEMDHKTKTKELAAALAELKEVREEATRLHFSPRNSGATFRDAKEFGIIRDAIHHCAEEKGELRAVAVGFVMTVEKMGGNLQALGIDQRCYQDMKTFVLGGQNPASAIQPVGFR